MYFSCRIARNPPISAKHRAADKKAALPAPSEGVDPEPEQAS